MFERFTEQARQMVVLAQEEARLLKHNYIGTEHLLLGLLRDEGGPAGRVLESLGVTSSRVRAQVVQIVGSGEEVTSGQIPFTPRAKKVLELALREALSLDHNYIGTEHVLLGLVLENGGLAMRILLDFDADAKKVRNAVLQIVSGPEYEEHQPPRPAETFAIREAAGELEAIAVPTPPAVTPASAPASFVQVLARAFDQAVAGAGGRSLDAGDLILALLERPDPLISQALTAAGIDVGALRVAIELARQRGE